MLHHVVEGKKLGERLQSYFGWPAVSKHRLECLRLQSSPVSSRSSVSFSFVLYKGNVDNFIAESPQLQPARLHRPLLAQLFVASSARCSS